MVNVNELFVDYYYFQTKIDARSSYRLPLDSPLGDLLYMISGITYCFSAETRAGSSKSPKIMIDSSKPNDFPTTVFIMI